jgi:hypothetical protein
VDGGVHWRWATISATPMTVATAAMTSDQTVPDGSIMRRPRKATSARIAVSKTSHGTRRRDHDPATSGSITDDRRRGGDHPGIAIRIATGAPVDPCQDEEAEREPDRAGTAAWPSQPARRGRRTSATTVAAASSGRTTPVDRHDEQDHVRTTSGTPRRKDRRSRSVGRLGVGTIGSMSIGRCCRP